jgi:hypothetical protein
MGVPTSGILSEIYLEYLEQIGIYDLLKKHNIISYLQNVDDILIIYDHIVTNTEYRFQ